KTCQTSAVRWAPGASGISAKGASCPGRNRTSQTRAAWREKTAKLTPPGRGVAPNGRQWPRAVVKAAAAGPWAFADTTSPFTAPRGLEAGWVIRCSASAGRDGGRRAHATRQLLWG